VVAQKLFAIPWKEVAIIVKKNEQKSGLSEHGKPLFLAAPFPFSASWRRKAFWGLGRMGFCPERAEYQ